MYHGQLLFRDHGQTPLPQHCQPWSNMVGNEKQWYHGHPVAGVQVIHSLQSVSQTAQDLQ